ncbi:MAG TPA: hypothetical protein DCY03_06975 [Planctomycetaceae bacterium]|nr:hypothetical protein [Planctomycetaceae bacterium]
MSFDSNSSFPGKLGEMSVVAYHCFFGANYRLARLHSGWRSLYRTSGHPIYLGDTRGVKPGTHTISITTN